MKLICECGHFRELHHTGLNLCVGNDNSCACAKVAEFAQRCDALQEDDE